MKIQYQTNLAGILDDRRQELLSNLHGGEQVRIVPAPDTFDENALAVLGPGGEMLGYIPSGYASRLKGRILKPIEGHIVDMTGGYPFSPLRGCIVAFTLEEEW